MSQADVSETHPSELSLDDVVALYRAVGWSVYADHPDYLLAALDGSSRVVVARLGGRIVGLARVLSDGASICYLQDVLVHPDVHRTGIDRQLVTLALESEDVPAGQVIQLGRPEHKDN